MAVTLHICGGYDGYRLAFVGPGTFEVAGVFRTFDEAARAKRAAEASSAAVDAWLAATTGRRAA